MLLKNPIPRRRRRHRTQGFALLATLMLMSLLLVIGLATLSLSTVSLRMSDRDRALQIARQNARLGLMLAIGELQRSMGPDQRISAPSSLHTESKQPHLTGVWESWKWDGRGSAPDYLQEKQRRFVRWLTSGREENLTDEKWPDTIAPGRTAELVKETLSGDELVAAPVVEIPGGGFAWAAFDQSMKASMPSRAPEKETTPPVMETFGAAPYPGFEAASERDWKALGAKRETYPVMISLAQTAFTGITSKEISFHDLATDVTGMPINVADGGFAKDLSLLFEPEVLPAPQSSQFLYSGTATPFAPAPARFNGANPLPSPDPSWNLLHSHYRLYRDFAGSGLVATPRVDARPAAGAVPSSSTTLAAFNRQQIFPVVAKAQFVFSLSFGYHPAIDELYASGAALRTPEKEKDKFVSWLVIDPVITLWNPHNAPLRVTEARVDLHRIPLTMRFYKNNELVNSDYTHFSNLFLSENFANRADKYYRLNLLPETGKEELVMEPGEHVVFTAHNHVKHFNHAYSVTGVDLRPGFHAPAGNASDAEVGGCSTLNICVNSTGTASGKVRGKPARTIPVKAGDRIAVEVKPGRSGIDKPRETGGKEITGFIKYYGGTKENPLLIGGSEIDYGSEEAQLLPAFTREDLPEVVVPSGIPETQAADNYVGTKPPPVVRFKEPFLIATFSQKTERDAREPSAAWLHNSPTALYSSAGIDQQEARRFHQYEFGWEAMTDWPPTSPTIEISNTRNRGYGAAGIYAQSGVNHAVFSSIPLSPALSIPQLRHAPLNNSGLQPLTCQIIGNSHPHPLLPADRISANVGERTYLDHCFLANNALFDAWFFSSAASRRGPFDKTSVTSRKLLEEFFAGENPLPNPRFIPEPLGENSADLAERLATDPEAWRTIASHLRIDAPFNVNSTRVAAWEAVLASNFGESAPVMTNGNVADVSGEGVPVLRHLPSTGTLAGTSATGHEADTARRNGYRRLDEKQIAALAKAIVHEVRGRGPFLSLAEFVNRQPGSGDAATSGTMEAAIREAALNNGITSQEGNLPDQNASVGMNTASGSPAVISQADLLTPLAPMLTARGETFVIRAYGEATARDRTRVTARCEATVVRTARYLDPADAPSATPTTEMNRQFGRRFELTAFRWLLRSEI